MITLTMSEAPSANSITSESRKLRDSPKTIVVIPKMLTHANITIPDRLRSGRYANSNETRPIVVSMTACIRGRWYARCTQELLNDAAVRTAVEHFGGLDILVNAAGILASGTIENTTLTAWDEMMNVNLRAVFHLMNLATPHLIARRGNIVNVSSVTGLRSFPGVLAYCVSKAAVDHLTSPAWFCSVSHC